LSPKVALRWAKRSTLPGPETKLPPSWKGFCPGDADGPAARAGPCGSVAAEEMEERRRTEPGRAIRLPPLVDQGGDPRLLAEGAGVGPVPEPHGGQARPRGDERRLVLAQLRDVLAAEDSAVVAEEDQDRRAVGPQRVEPHRGPVGVGERDPAEPLGERHRYAATSTRVSL
jgi:hypothetical protein